MRLRAISWPRAAAFATAWTVAAIGLIVAVLVLPVWPGGAVWVSIAEETVLTILLAAPVVAGFVHRSLKVPALVTGYLASLILVIGIVVAVNLPRENHDQRYQRLRQGTPPATQPAPAQP